MAVVVVVRGAAVMGAEVVGRDDDPAAGGCEAAVVPVVRATVSVVLGAVDLGDGKAAAAAAAV